MPKLINKPAKDCSDKEIRTYCKLYCAKLGEVYLIQRYDNGAVAVYSRWEQMINFHPEDPIEVVVDDE